MTHQAARAIISLTKALKKGTYTLKEVKAPEGYLLADKLTFEVSGKHSYLDPLEVVCYDAPQQGGDKAYSQGKTIVLPAKEQFFSQYQYYSTVFHELAHSTGHFIAERTGLSYAKEELVAEISASFLCAATRLQDDRSMENNVTYYIRGEISKEVYIRKQRELLEKQEIRYF